jgi:hypothetical protein
MATSRDKQIVGGLVVLVGLGALVWRQTKKDAQLGAPPTTAGDMPTISGTDDIDKIDITNADKGEVVLEKKDDKWTVTLPVNAPANQQNVKSLIDNLKELKAKEVIADQGTDDLMKSYDLVP